MAARCRKALILICSFIVLMSRFPGARAAELVLHYDFNTDEGPVALDVSGYGNHASVSGATYVAMSSGGALGFDGIGDFLFVPQSDSLSITGSLTMAAWMRVCNYNRQRPILEWNHAGTASGIHMWTGVWGWQWFGLGTGANLVDVTGNENAYVISTANPPPNEWHHLAVSYDQSSGYARVYINGVLMAESFKGWFVPRTAMDLYIGKRPGQPNDLFCGLLDDIRVYNGVLSSNDIYALCADTVHEEQTQGAVRCVIEPAAARADGARWRIEGGQPSEWMESGAVLDGLPAGEHTIGFNPVDGWIAPAAQSVQVLIGQTAQRQVSYALPASTSNALVLYYDFNTNSGDIVYDQSGCGNHGLVSGATHVPSDCGGAYEFNGVSDFIMVPRSETLDVAGSLTLAAWFKVYNYNQQRPILEWCETNGVSGAHMWTGVYGWQWSGRGTGANLVDVTGNENAYVVSVANPQANLWHHLAVTYDRSTGIGRVYVNGQLNGEKQMGVFTPKTYMDLYIGKRVGQVGDLMYGLLDEVRVYSGALTAGEISELYTQHSGCRQPAGGVRCTIQPADARADGAQWRLTTGPDTNWKNSESEIAAVPVGSYTLQFKPITGWLTPESQLIHIEDGQTCFATGTYSPDINATNELVLYYSFNADHGAVAMDLSGFGNHGVIHGATYVPGDCGGAYEFDGSNDWIFVPRSESLDVAGSLTMAAWIHVVNYDRQRPILEWSDGEGFTGAHMWTGVWGWQWFGLGTGANLVDVTRNENAYVVSVANPPAGQWHHLAVTYDRNLGQAQVYINGTLARERPLGTFTPMTAHDLYIGCRPNQPGDLFYGLMDEVRVYKGALNAGEVRELFLNKDPCPPEMGTVTCMLEPYAAQAAGARWRLTEGFQTEWNESGAVLANIAEGPNTVSFKEIAGWSAPADQAVLVARGVPTVVTGEYSLVEIGDTAPPVIVEVYPPDGYVTISNQLLMRITVTDNVAVASVKVNGTQATAAGGALFEYIAKGIRKSYNPFTIIAVDTSGNIATQMVNYVQSARMRLHNMWDGYWRVRNPHSEAVDYTWEVINEGIDETGAGTAPPNSDSYFTSSSGHRVIRLMVDGIQVDVANSYGVHPQPEGLLNGMLDSDGDGRSNYEEEIAGTDINNPFDYFELYSIPPAPAEGMSLYGHQRQGDVEESGQNLVISWFGDEDSVYSIAASIDLENWYFVPDYVAVPGSGEMMSYTNTMRSEVTLFLRLTAEKRP